MNRRLMAAALVITAAAPAGAELTVSLWPVEVAGPAGGPYRAATLTVDNSDGSVAELIGAAAIRCLDGGPTFVQPIAVPPRTKQSVVIRLPAVSLRQEVDVRLLEGDRPDAPLLASRRVVIDWPMEAIARADWPLIDREAYGAWERERSLPTWPGGVRRNVLVTLVLASVAAAATLLVRRAGLRIIALAAVAVASSGVLIAQLAAVDGTSVDDFHFERQVATRPAVESVLAATCLRTTEWRGGEADIVPVYRSEEQMAGDTTVIHPARGLRVTLRPHDVRLFRRH